MTKPKPMETSRVSREDLPTVLVVDDDAEILSALKRAFRDEPYEILATEDPFRALGWIQSRRVDVVIADEFMPAMRGTELLEAARRHSPRSASVVLTGYPNTTVASRAHQQRVDLLLSKPWEDELLRKSVRLLLSSRRDRPLAGRTAGGKS